MATKEKNTEHRDDTLLAAIALAADRQKPAGDCLSAEKLAALAEGRCSSQERRAAETHLAECERCYSQWCAVAEVMEERAARRKIIPLFRPRNLAWLGSALAIAASVVVFVHLQDTALQTTVCRVPATIQVQKSTDENAADKRVETAGKPALESEMTMEEDRSKVLEQPTAPRETAMPERSAHPETRESAAADSAVQLKNEAFTVNRRETKQKEKAAQAVVTQSKKAERPKSAVQAKAAAPKTVAGGAHVMNREEEMSRSKSVPPAAAPAGAPAITEQTASPTMGRMAVADPVTEWLHQVAFACRQGNEDLESWRKLAERGKAIEQESGGKGYRQELIARVLTAIAAMGKREDIAGRCESLKPYLATALGTR